MSRDKLNFEALQGRISQSPFNQWMNVRLERMEEDGITVSCVRRPEMVGSVYTGALHGGLLGCLLDTAASFALIARTGQTVATIDFRVNFHRPCTATQLQARARVVHDGRKLATVDVQLSEGDGSRLVASGQGVFHHLLLPTTPAAGVLSGAG